MKNSVGMACLLIILYAAVLKRFYIGGSCLRKSGAAAGNRESRVVFCKIYSLTANKLFASANVLL